MSDFKDQFYAALQRKRQLPATDALRAQRQEQNQIFHGKRRLVYMPIVERRPNFWQVDTTFYPLKGVRRAIFTAIEVNKKLGFIAPYSGSAPNASQTVRFLQQLLTSYPVHHIGADNGSEFVAKSVKEFLSSKGVGVYYYTPYDSNEKAVIERFNGTVKDYLNKVAYSVDANWIPYIPKIMEAYNNAPHASTGTPPNEMTDRDVEEYLFKQIMKGREYQRYLHEFTPGTKVRIFRDADPLLSSREKLAEKQFAKKDYPRWTKEIYIVDGIDGYKVKLVGLPQRFSPRSLLVVSTVETHEPEEKPVAKPQARTVRKVGQVLAELDQAPRAVETAGRATRSHSVAPELYQIEAILGNRIKNGKPQFRVKWAGMPNSSNTWEYATRFVQTKQEPMLDAYLSSL